MSDRLLQKIAGPTARVALAASFLSAVADRIGWYGAPGAPGVSWGDWQSFEAYTGVLLGPLPGWFVSISAVAATVAEVVFAVLILAGVRLRLVSLASAGLLAVFAVAMMFAHGIKAPLAYSVPSAMAAALLLAAREGRPI